MSEEERQALLRSIDRQIAEIDRRKKSKTPAELFAALCAEVGVSAPGSELAAEHPPVLVNAERKRRRTRAELANDRIIEEQKRVAEGSKRAEAMAKPAKAEWEAGRPREPVGVDYSRFTF